MFFFPPPYQTPRIARDPPQLTHPLHRRPLGQDLPDAMPPHKISYQLGLQSLPETRQWHVQAACATNGDGLYEGLGWLTDALSDG